MEFAIPAGKSYSFWLAIIHRASSMNLINPRRTSICVTMLFVVAAWLPSLHATTWYVNGSATGPTHDGTTPTTAWLTFAAIQQSELSGGDVVLIFPGNYNEVFVITKSGTSANA